MQRGANGAVNPQRVHDIEQLAPGFTNTNLDFLSKTKRNCIPAFESVEFIFRGKKCFCTPININKCVRIILCNFGLCIVSGENEDGRLDFVSNRIDFLFFCAFNIAANLLEPFSQFWVLFRPMIL